MKHSKSRPMVFITIFLAMILISGIIPGKAYGAESSGFIRVGLGFGDSGLSSCTLSSDTGFVLGSVTDSGFTETLPLPAYRTLTAALEGGHVALRDADGVLISADIGKNGCLMPLNDSGNAYISFDGNRYRGGFLLSANKSSRIDVINYLGIEEYLYGVVHLEMSQSNPLEALKAQAVAARSFALAHMGRHKDSGFDVCASTHCQVYGGVKAEYPSTTDAVDGTLGLAIYWNGKPAAVNYHKNSGGHTQNAGDVWSSDLPYQTGKEDPYTPAYPWSAVITFDSLEQKLVQAGLITGTIKTVAIGGRSSAGTVASLVIEGSQGAVTLEKERIRTVLGASLVRSRYFNIGDTYQGMTAGGGETVSFVITNGTIGKTAGGTLYTVSADGAVNPLNSQKIHLFDGNRTIIPDRILAGGPESSVDRITATDGKLTLSGMGSGHGAGMSQDGAIEMAKQGFPFLDILNFYFTDIEVR